MTRRKPRYLPLGSISTGTLRNEDIIPELLDLGNEVRMNSADRREWRYLESEYKNEPALLDLEGGSIASEYIERLYDLLQAYAPPFCYVGSHPGDGADIGVWVSEDILQGNPHDDNDGVERSSESGKPSKGYEFRLWISDHGNATLYDHNGREVWGVV